MSPLSAFVLYSPVSLQLLRLEVTTRLSLDWKGTNVNLSV